MGRDYSSPMLAHFLQVYGEAEETGDTTGLPTD
jgi:hypothetical protein